MSEAQALMCSTCGAPLTFKPGETQVKCEYCGNVMVIPENLRQKELIPQAFAFTPPVIQIQTSPMIQESIYTAGRRSSRLGGCLIVSLVLFILVVTTLPFLATSAVVSSVLDSVFKQVPALQNVAQAVSGYATETMSFGGDGTGPGLFQDPRQLAIDGKGNLYVSDYNTGRIQRLDPDGKFLNTWTVDGKKPIIQSMAADRAGNVYVVQAFVFPRTPILKYDGTTGKLLATISDDKSSFEYVAVLPDGNLLAYSSANGSDDLVKLSPDGKVINRTTKAFSSQLDSAPVSISLAADGLGNTYVLSQFDRTVLKFGSSGKFNTRWGKEGDADGEFKSLPNSIAVDGKSRVYVGDFGRILVFDAGGRYLDMIASSTYATYSMGFNDKNELYILSQGKVHKLTLKNP